MSQPAKRANRRVLVAGLVTLPLVVVAAVWWWEQKLQNAYHGPVHAFRVENPPPFLTDALAVEKASEALALDGFDLSDWGPQEDRRTSAPDGTTDVYLARNGNNPNSGYLSFVDRSGRAKTPGRIVHAELSGGRLTCQVVHPK
jgi:hypothetical protein